MNKCTILGHDETEVYVREDKASKCTFYWYTCERCGMKSNTNYSHYVKAWNGKKVWNHTWSIKPEDIFEGQ